jgi:hypothetical protein
MIPAGWMSQLASERDEYLVGSSEAAAAAPEPPPPEPPPPEFLPGEGAPAEFDGDPQEMWIEEYEREGRHGKPKKERRKPRHIGRWIALAVVIVILVVWTLISPPVMSEVGSMYLNPDTHANLGSMTAEQDVQILASLLSVGTTTWGVSIHGDGNATTDEAAVFEVMVTKVSEEPRSFWFMGTEISLRNVSFYLEDDTLIGWMTEKDELRNMSLGYVHATFTETGIHDCYVVLRFSVYEVMRIGFLPADKVNMTVWLSDSIIVSEQAGPGP